MAVKNDNAQISIKTVCPSSDLSLLMRQMSNTSDVDIENVSADVMKKSINSEKIHLDSTDDDVKSDETSHGEDDDEDDDYFKSKKTKRKLKPKIAKNKKKTAKLP